MPTAKIRYTAAEHGGMPEECVREQEAQLAVLAREIALHLPYSEDDHDAPFGSQIDQLVEELVAAARDAMGELGFVAQCLTVQEIKRTHRDLLDTLDRARRQLRSLFPDHENLLPSEFEPRALADQIAAALAILAVNPLDFSADRKVGARVSEREAEERLGHLVAEALHKYGFEVNATAPGADELLPTFVRDHPRPKARQLAEAEALRRTSAAIKILKSIGDAIGIVRKHETWRDVLAAAKPSLGSESA